MKKLIAVIAALALLFAVAVAEFVDLSAMTFDELAQLQKAIIQEMQSRDEFKSVWVPQGIYIVGEDIPAGIYSFSASDFAAIEIYSGDSSEIHNYEDGYSLGAEDGKVAKYELKDGYYVEISFGSVLFETYTGLSF